MIHRSLTLSFLVSNFLLGEAMRYKCVCRNLSKLLLFWWKIITEISCENDNREYGVHFLWRNDHTSTDFLRKQPWHKKHSRLIHLPFGPITVTKNGQVRGIYYDRNNRWRNGRASISPAEHDRSSRLTRAATVNRACRQPEILTNHTEKERDGCSHV